MKMMMRCIFVLDLFNGEVVHARRGQRELYRPINLSSKLVDTSDPLETLQKLRPTEVYVADLNRITKADDNMDTIQEMAGMTRIMADIGLSEIQELDLLPEPVVPVAGTETASWELIASGCSCRPLVVSIDLMNRKVISRDSQLRIPPLDLISLLNDYPLEAVILLELDRVGTSSGVDLEFLGQAVRTSRHPLIQGGGVKDDNDLETLEVLGISGALVATGVHNGKIPLHRLQAPL